MKFWFLKSRADAEAAREQAQRLLSLFGQWVPITLVDELRDSLANMSGWDAVARMSSRRWNSMIHEMLDQKQVVFTEQETPQVRLQADLEDSVRRAFFESDRRLARETADRLFRRLCAMNRMRHRRAIMELGCLAERYQEAFDFAFRDYKRQGLPNPNTNNRADELKAIAAFFQTPWSQPHAGLTDRAVALLRHDAAMCLRANGQMSESEPLFQNALETYLDHDDALRAAMCSNHMVVMYICRCRLADALIHALIASEFGRNKTNDPQRRVRGQSAVGSVLFRAGMRSEACAPFAYSVYRGVKNIAIPVWRKCRSLITSGRCSEALRLANWAFRKLDEERTGFGNLGFCLLVTQQIAARCRLDRKAYFRSRHTFERALCGLRKIGLLEDVVESLLLRASLALRAGAGAESVEADILEAEAICNKTDMPLYVIEAKLLRCELLASQGHLEEARQIHADYRQLQDATAQPFMPHLSRHTQFDKKYVNKCKPGQILRVHPSIADRKWLAQTLKTA